MREHATIQGWFLNRKSEYSNQDWGNKMVEVMQIVFCLGVPALTLALRDKIKLIDIVSPIAMCYAIGILVGNLSPQPFDEKLALNICAATVLLAIPLLLFSVDIIAWLRLAHSTLTACLAAFVSVTVVSTLVGFLLQHKVADAALVSGMLTGLFTGGTVNMSAISVALGVEPAVFVLVNVSDVALCGTYFLWMLSIGYKWFGRFLPVESSTPGLAADTFAAGDNGASCSLGNSGEAIGTAVSNEIDTEMQVRAADLVKPISLALLAAALAGLATLIVPKSLEETVAILSVTSIAIAFSFSPKVRSLTASYAAGDYMLMVFSVSMGSIARVDRLFGAGAEMYILFTALVLIGTLTLHVILCKLFKIDRDTMLITSTAGLFGPAFVAPVASRLGRPELVVSGICCGLIGIASGTYLGVALGKILQQFMV